MRIKLSISFILVLIIIFSKADAEEKAKPYVDGSKSFLEIKDVNKQSAAWAMCSATYDMMAEISSEERPARAQQLKELSNGAEIAVTMSIVTDGLEPNISKEKFNALWTAAKLAGTDLPKTRRTMLAAEAEAFFAKENKDFLEKLSATLEVCLRNLEGQEMYINAWRELAKSGLLKVPSSEE